MRQFMNSLEELCNKTNEHSNIDFNIDFWFISNCRD